MTNPITAKNFGSKLGSWKRSATSMRSTAQALLEFGFDRYAENGDAGYLSRMVAAAREIKGLNASRMMAYVTAHANVRWNEEKGSFSKAKKKDEPVVQERAVSWYEFGKAEPTPRPLDVNKRLESMLKAVQDADEVKFSSKEAYDTLRKIRSELEALELQALELETAEERAAA